MYLDIFVYWYKVKVIFLNYFFFLSKETSIKKAHQKKHVSKQVKDISYYLCNAHI